MSGRQQWGRTLIDLRPRERREATAAELAAKEAKRLSKKQKAQQTAKAAFFEGLSKQRQAAASAVAPPDAGVSCTLSCGRGWGA